MAYTFPASQIKSSYRRGIRKIVATVTSDAQTTPYTISINAVNPVTGVAPAFSGVYQILNEGTTSNTATYQFSYSTATGNMTVTGDLDANDQIVIIGSND